jgi:hypothetical protein
MLHNMASIKSSFCQTLILALLLSSFSLPQISVAQVVHRIYFERFPHYSVDDWITYAPATEVTSIDIGDEYVYCGTQNGGILRYHLYNNLWDYPVTTSNGLSSNRILQLVYDYKSNTLVVKTDRGIDTYNRGFNYWLPAYIEELPERRQPSEVEIADFLQHPNYRYPSYYRPALDELPGFFTDRDFLFRPPDEILDPYNRIFHLSPERVTDNFQRLWLGTDGLGLARVTLNNYNLKFERQSVPNIYCRDVYLDSNGVWIGGIANGKAPGGIAHWDFTDNTWRYFETRFVNGVYSDNVNAIAGVIKFIFFATDYGLLRFNQTKDAWQTFTTANRLNSDRINDLAVWRDRLFIATARGFHWMERGYHAISEPSDRRLISIAVNKILPMKNTVLLATNYGIYEYDPLKDELSLMPTGSSLPDSRITALGADREILWIAGDYGISSFDMKSGEWRSFPGIAPELNAAIHDIAFTDGFVWFATESGLLRYDPTRDYWYLYTNEDGLADDRVYHIDVDADELWLSTHAGVNIFRWLREGRTE